MRLERQLKAMIMGISVLIVGLLSPRTVLQIQAAGSLTVTNLKVLATPDGMGIVAKCSYENYTDQSGCAMRLYLYRNEGGRDSIETQKILSYADQGSESTDSAQVPEGIYYASVVMDYGTELRQINSQNFFMVQMVDGEYIVTEEIMNTEKIQKGATQAQDYVICNHTMEYALVQEATPVRNSVLAYQCMQCKTVLEYIEVPNSAYVAFLKETENIIINAQSKEAIVSTGLWLSFNKDVFEAMKKRPDVTVIVNYRYQGEMEQIVIPAGIDVEFLMDENGFCGFRHMAKMLRMSGT